MKRYIVGGIVAAAMLILPAFASAHSGTVTCDSRGVVFSYRADFPVTTTVTESVDGVTKTFVVPRRTSVVDIMSFGAATVVASSTWSGGGSIPPTTLTCPYTPPPVTPPSPPLYNCPEGTLPDTTATVPNAIVCVRTVTVTVPVEVVRYVETPRPPARYSCPKGTKKSGFNSKTSVLTCLKTVNHTVVKFKIKYIKPWKPLPPKHHTPGVTG